MPAHRRQQQRTSRTHRESFNSAAQPGDFIRRLAIRGATAALLAGTALSALLQVMPDTVSTPAADYLAGRGYPSSLRAQFQAKSVRVYDRDNPLVAVHLAGHYARMIWAKSDNLLKKVTFSPMAFVIGAKSGYDLLHNDSRLAAYSYSSAQTNAAARDVFIWPSDDAIPTTQWLQEMTGLRAQHLDFGAHNEEQMRHVLAEFVLLHEMRHGDQDKEDVQVLSESDADAYALHLIGASGTPPALVGEARAFVTAARTVSAILNSASGRDSHTTALALQRGMEGSFTRTNTQQTYALNVQALQDGSAFTNASLMLRGVMFDNDFPKGMQTASIYYHAAQALIANGVVNANTVSDPVVMYVNAMTYLDHLAGGTIIERTLDAKSIDVSRFISPDTVAPPDASEKPADSRPAAFKPR